MDRKRYGEGDENERAELEQLLQLLQLGIYLK